MVLVIVNIWLDGCTDHATTDGDGDGDGKDDDDDDCPTEEGWSPLQTRPRSTNTT